MREESCAPVCFRQRFLDRQVQQFARGDAPDDAALSDRALSGGGLHFAPELVGQLLDSVGAREALEKRRPLISDPYVSALNRLVVLVSQPIFADDGTYQGYIGGSIYLQHENILHSLLGEHFYQDGSYLYVVDRNRRLIYHQEQGRVGEIATGNPVVERVIRGEEGSQALINSRGIEMLAGFSPVATSGWGIVAQRPLELALAELDGLMLNILRLSLPMLLLSLGGIWWLSHLISRPLWQLAKSAQQWDTDESPEQVRRIKAWYFETDQLKRAVLSGLALLHLRLGKLSQESLTDPLTGLTNRRGLQAQLAQWQRQSRPFAVVALDIDHFKQVNDRYGHQIGDEVLRATAGLLQQSIRAADHLGRYGGEEFLAILPMTEPAAAAERASGRAIGDGPATRFVTAALHVDYLKPTPLGPGLEIRGRVRQQRQSRRQQHRRAGLSSAAGTLRLPTCPAPCSTGRSPARW